MRKYNCFLLSMKYFFLLAAILSGQLYAQNMSKITEINITECLVSSGIGVHHPAFTNQKNLKGKEFKANDILSLYDFSLEQLRFVNDTSGFKFNGNAIPFRNKDLKKTSFASGKMYFVVTYLDLDSFCEPDLLVKTTMPFQLFVDGKLFKTIDEPEKKKANKIKIKLETGKHQLIFKLLGVDKKSKLAVAVSLSEKAKSVSNIFSSTDPKRTMDIDLLMNGVRLEEVSISPKGSFITLSYKETEGPKGKTKSWTDIKSVTDNKLVQRFSDGERNFNWKPNSDIILYTKKEFGKHAAHLFDVTNHSFSTIASNDKAFSSIQWSPNAEYLVFSIRETFESRKDGVKLFEGMPDRWPWWRTRSNLYRLDAESGAISPITWGHISSNIQDISPDGKRILFSQSIPNYDERPFAKEFLFEMNMDTYKVDTIWESKFGGRAQYSPDGQSLLVISSPAAFGEVGQNLEKDTVPNDFDSQAYIYNIKEKKAKSITTNFDPSIIDAHWSKVDGNIYFLAEAGTYNNVYKYNMAIKNFQKLSLGQDVIEEMSFSETGANFVFLGNSISSPNIAGFYDLDTETYYVLDEPEKDVFEHVDFGLTEEWNFTNKEGSLIEGRIYYPPGFDSRKKYPLIVYYYGGTSPTTRNFRGRYPKNLFAANGYIVYVPQPSGATGYGQKFSAKHVNNWGQSNAQDIIDGTTQFLSSHSFVDPKRVGCIGASYGGFLTMSLTTQTDIFAAAISHAGISSISSYWGEGYWGYSYSSVASANSYTWNNKELYTKQSPLFNADKVNTPILLLHGNSDTNVPPGESIQFFTALKLLGKDVTYIEIDKQDHHIVDYEKRILWQKTILAYFDKYLKGQNEWWNVLYPERNL